MELVELIVAVAQFGLAGVALMSLSFALKMAHETIRLHIELSYGVKRPHDVNVVSPVERSGASPDGITELTS